MGLEVRGGDEQLSKLAATRDYEKENWKWYNMGRAVSQGVAVVRLIRELEQLEEFGCLFYLWPSASIVYQELNPKSCKTNLSLLYCNTWLFLAEIGN